MNFFLIVMAHFEFSSFGVERDSCYLFRKNFNNL